MKPRAASAGHRVTEPHRPPHTALPPAWAGTVGQGTLDLARGTPGHSGIQRSAAPALATPCRRPSAAAALLSAALLPASPTPLQAPPHPGGGVCVGAAAAALLRRQRAAATARCGRQGGRRGGARHAARRQEEGAPMLAFSFSLAARKLDSSCEDASGVTPNTSWPCRCASPNVPVVSPYGPCRCTRCRPLMAMRPRRASPT